MVRLDSEAPSTAGNGGGEVMVEPVKTAQGFTLPKAARLLKRPQFLALTQKSARPDLTIKAGSFLVLGCYNGLGRCRLGLTTSRKVGPAVIRNRLKRQVREFYRLNVGSWPQGLDLLFIARQQAGQMTSPAVAVDLAKIGQKLKSQPPRPKSPGSPPPDSQPGGRPSSPPPGDQASQFGVSDNCNQPGQAAAPPKTAAFFLRAGIQHLQKEMELLALALIKMYQCFISPMLPPACRFWPTCSNYAAQAILIHGVWFGSYLTARRLLKCHPFHPGGYDPVPLKTPRVAPPI